MKRVVLLTSRILWDDRRGRFVPQAEGETVSVPEAEATKLIELGQAKDAPPAKQPAA